MVLIDDYANIGIKLNEEKKSRAGNFIATLLNYDIFTFCKGGVLLFSCALVKRRTWTPKLSRSRKETSSAIMLNAEALVFNYAAAAGARHGNES